MRVRFRREARILDRLNHPNAVRVYDARMGKDVAFIEMEYVRGKSLNQVLVPGVPMPLDWVVDLLDQLCSVLQAASDEGIIHRDLKPQNLMLVEGRQPGTKILKLLDFGIAKIREGADDVRTLTGSFMGTPLYSSPEQIVGERVDSRSDIYSVGLILCELLTGYRPFDGSMNAVIYKHTMVPPPSFAELNPEAVVPPQVEEVVRMCLAKEPAQRPQTLRELAERFHNAIAAGKGKFGDGNVQFTGPAPKPPPTRHGRKDRFLDENVQFTVYRPKSVQPAGWYPMLVFAHLAERRPDAPKAEADPIEQVRAQARQVLGARAKEFRDTSVDSRQAVPREGEITLLPDVPGVEFNPERRIFRWIEDVHREEFRLRASPGLDGMVARGRLSAYLGAILLAEVDLVIRVDSTHRTTASDESHETASARPYRKIFASYSHKDVAIVRQYETLVQSVRRPLSPRRPQPPRRRGLGPPSLGVDRGCGRLPTVLVVELDALAVRATRMGTRTRAGSPLFHPTDLLGGPPTEVARRQSPPR